MLTVRKVKTQILVKGKILFGFPTQLKYILAPLLLFAIVFLLELLKPASMSLLGFYPEKIAAGELWRIVTGQVLHTNFNHVLLNVAGLLLVWALHGEYYRAKHYALIVTLSLVLVGIPLAVLYDTTHYAGLSGIIHTLIVYGALIDIHKKVTTGWLILIGVFVKVGYENIFGASSDTAALIAANVAVEAHLIGAVAGLIIGIGYWFINKRA